MELISDCRLARSNHDEIFLFRTSRKEILNVTQKFRFINFFSTLGGAVIT